MERGSLPLKQSNKFILQPIVRAEPERYLHSVVWNYGKLHYMPLGKPFILKFDD